MLSWTTNREVAANCDSGGSKQAGHPFNTLGPNISPSAVSCTAQVHSSTMVVARIIHSFILAPFNRSILASPTYFTPILAILLPSSRTAPSKLPYLWLPMHQNDEKTDFLTNSVNQAQYHVDQSNTSEIKTSPNPLIKPMYLQTKKGRRKNNVCRQLIHRDQNFATKSTFPNMKASLSKQNPTMKPSYNRRPSDWS